MRTRTLSIVLVSVALAACGGKKKDNGGAASGTAAGTGSGTAGTGSGTAAGTGSGTAAGTGSGTAAGTGADPTAIDPAMANKAGNCPSTVIGARSELIEDKTLPNAVVLSITAGDDAAVATIRSRTAHLVAVQSAPDAQIKHSGEGTGGGAGMCPVVTSKDVTIASSEIPNGVKVVLTPTGAGTAQDLARDIVGRIDQINAFRAKPSDSTGGGGADGDGGGTGKHGGNHSGDGDGKGREKAAAGSGAAQPGAQ